MILAERSKTKVCDIPGLYRRHGQLKGLFTLPWHEKSGKSNEY